MPIRANHFIPMFASVECVSFFEGVIFFAVFVKVRFTGASFNISSFSEETSGSSSELGVEEEPLDEARKIIPNIAADHAKRDINPLIKGDPREINIEKKPPKRIKNPPKTSSTIPTTRKGFFFDAVADEDGLPSIKLTLFSNDDTLALRFEI